MYSYQQKDLYKAYGKCFLHGIFKYYTLLCKQLQEVLQKMLKDPVLQECRLRTNVDGVDGDELLQGHMTSKQGLQVTGYQMYTINGGRRVAYLFLGQRVGLILLLLFSFIVK